MGRVWESSARERRIDQFRAAKRPAQVVNRKPIRAADGQQGIVRRDRHRQNRPGRSRQRRAANNFGQCSGRALRSLIDPSFHEPQLFRRERRCAHLVVGRGHDRLGLMRCQPQQATLGTLAGHDDRLACSPPGANPRRADSSDQIARGIAGLVTRETISCAGPAESPFRNSPATYAARRQWESARASAEEGREQGKPRRRIWSDSSGAAAKILATMIAASSRPTMEKVICRPPLTRSPESAGRSSGSQPADGLR